MRGDFNVSAFKSDKRVDDMVKLLSGMVNVDKKTDLGTDTPKSE